MDASIICIIISASFALQCYYIVVVRVAANTITIITNTWSEVVINLPPCLPLFLSRQLFFSFL